jgi:nucleotide-binding universal stress UspA family protein
VVPNKENHKALVALEAQLAHVPHEIQIRTGDVWPELAEILCTRNIDLVVIGTHGRTGAGKALMGSVAEKIFRHTYCPVLTIGPSVSGEPESIADLHEILFATDFSEESRAALPYAISLAQRDGARLYLVHVVPAPIAPETKQHLKARLDAMIPEGAEFTCKPKTLVECGMPAQKILETAEELGTDLIVLGVKRKPVHFEWSAHLPVATAYKVVSSANCPVLTVRG